MRSPRSVRQSIRRDAAVSVPYLIAHRGSHESAPENSLAAMSAALDAKADAVEIDVHVTHDGVLVVHHDPVVQVGSGSKVAASQPISELRYEQLKAFPLADGSPIAKLEDVLTMVKGRAHAHVEIKSHRIEKQTLECISRSGADASVHSFDHRIVKRCGEIDSGIPRGILIVSYLVDTVRVMRDADASDVWQNYEFVDADLVRDVHKAGGRVIAWTVNSAADAIMMAGIGVDAICTDSVRDMRTALQQA